LACGNQIRPVPIAAKINASHDHGIMKKASRLVAHAANPAKRLHKAPCQALYPATAGPAVMMTPMMAITQTSTTELPEPGRGSNNSISFELVAKFSMWIATHQYHQ